LLLELSEEPDRGGVTTVDWGRGECEIVDGVDPPQPLP
jgi:hypothetical protein